MSDAPPILLWLRRDFRLSDHPALSAAVASGRPIVPVFILDSEVDALGAAPKWRLGLGLAKHKKALAICGSRLVLRTGAPLACLQSLIEETGATSVYWSRLYDPSSIARDQEVKETLKSQGIEARSFGGHLLFEPWSVETKTGGFYRVYSPMWRAVKDRDVAAPLAAPVRIAPPKNWPQSERIEDWSLDAAMARGAAIVRPYVRLGEAAAQDRLAEFTNGAISDYVAQRDIPSVDGTSGLSENLTLGEISPHQCWHAGMRAHLGGAPGAETFLKELVWREFAYHLIYHTPHIAQRNWKPDWDRFAWNEDAGHPHVQAWMQGRTGIPFVDAGMRELYVTGRMHNRARMIVASYLTKHLLSHWKIGLKWFEACLVDWDPASNAMGWQWSAGSGPDATPYFRVFNPVTQLDKFDPERHYTNRWIAEGQGAPSNTALSYFSAIPKSWALSPDMPYPAAIISPQEGRQRALSAYETRGF